MANNVSFLLGEQTSVDDLIIAKTGITAGAFYVTNDTHRMYFGASETELVALNQGVISVKNTTQLPAADKSIPGSFYYLTDSNILCVYSGETHGWVQINADTRNTDVDTLASVVSAYENMNHTSKASLTYIVEDNRKSGNQVSGESYFEGKNIKITVNNETTGGDSKGTLILEGSVATLSTTAITNGVEVKVANSLGDSTKFNLLGDSSAGAKVTVTKNGDNITISAKDTYVSGLDVGVSNTANKATITTGVTNAGNNNTAQDDAFTISGDGENTYVVGTAETSSTPGSVTVHGADYTFGATAGAADKEVKLNSSKTLNGVDKGTDTVTLKGGTNVKTLSVAANAVTIDTYDTQVNEFEVTNNTTAGFDFVLSQTGSATTIPEKAQHIDPVIAYGDNQQTHFVNGTATLDVYDKTQVNNLLTSKVNAFNAMEYKGLIDETKANSIKTAGKSHVGDTYKVSSNFTVVTSEGSKTVKVGDLLVINGTEDSNGFVTADSFKWEHVPSGDDASIYTTEMFNTNGHGVQLLSGSSVVGEWKINDDTATNPIAVNSTLTAPSGSDGPKIAIDVLHKEIGTLTTAAAAQAQNQAGSVKGQIVSTTVSKVVRNLVKDDYGHIVSADIQDLTLYDTHAQLKDLGTVIISASTENKVAKISSTVYDTDEKSATTAFSLGVTSNNQSLDLDVDDTTDTVTINLVWGTF